MGLLNLFKRKRKPAPAPPPPSPPPSPCGCYEDHEHWTSRGWKCPHCAYQQREKRKAEEREAHAQRVAELVVQKLKEK